MEIALCITIAQIKMKKKKKEEQTGIYRYAHAHTHTLIYRSILNGMGATMLFTNRLLLMFT